MPGLTVLNNLDWFYEIIIDNKIMQSGNLWVSRLRKNNWSFSDEWKAHAEKHQQKTWDLTSDESLTRFFQDTRTNAQIISNKIILDAGCGNGILSRMLADAGAYVVGIDIQKNLPVHLSGDKLQFVQGDFDDPPFKANSFHIIVANGSIHHTPDTYRSFNSLAGLVKPGGKLYVWVYHKPKGFRDTILLYMLDFFRFFISRFPPFLQKPTVKMITGFFYVLSRIRKGENTSRSFDEIYINIYDAFTPKYRHYHHQKEIYSWYSKLGFKDVSVTDASSRYGFGILGIKE